MWDNRKLYTKLKKNGLQFIRDGFRFLKTHHPPSLQSQLSTWTIVRDTVNARIPRIVRSLLGFSSFFVLLNQYLIRNWYSKDFFFFPHFFASSVVVPAITIPFAIPGYWGTGEDMTASIEAIGSSWGLKWQRFIRST